MLLKMENDVNASLRVVSKLFRNVPFLTSLEMSLFLLICLLSLGCPPSEALRRGLCGAFRA